MTRMQIYVNCSFPSIVPVMELGFFPHWGGMVLKWKTGEMIKGREKDIEAW
jgi:hypothetical protein